MKWRFQKIFLCIVLCVGSLQGIRMRPEEIEELMRTMSQPKLVRTFADEEEHGDDPLEEPSMDVSSTQRRRDRREKRKENQNRAMEGLDSMCWCEPQLSAGTKMQGFKILGDSNAETLR